ncbi:MAG: hypothetical protein JXQ87_16240 [Bacteroidia bacterium]
MKKILYVFILCTITYSTSQACYREPTVFEKIASADVIAKVNFQFLDSSTVDVKSKHSKSGLRSFTVYNYAVSTAKSFKGELNVHKITLGSWQHKNMTGKQITLFMNYDSSRTSLKVNYIMNLKGEYISKLYDFYYEPSENELMAFCNGMENLNAFDSAEDYIQTVEAATNAITDNNYLIIYGQLSRLKGVLYDYFDSKTDWSLLNEKTIETTKEFFEKVPKKPILLVEMAYNLKFDNFKEVIVNHLNDFYCQNETENFADFKSSYSFSLEQYLIKNAKTELDKVQVASFIRKRYMHSHSNYLIHREAPLFDSLFDGLLISSDIESSYASSTSWNEKKMIKERILAKIVTYQPKENEPKLRTTFCTSEPSAIPKLKFNMAPNPTDGAFVISFEDVNNEEEIFIEIIGVGGDVIYQTSIMPYGLNFKKEFNIGQFEAGMYHMRIFNKYSIDTKMIQKF